MAIQIQMRRDSAADWTSNDPTLASGEIGFETDTGKAKFGDGSTAWTSLDYFAGEAGGTAFNIVLTPQSSCGPAANFATQDTIAGGSTPAEVVSVLDFDPDASEYKDFKFALPDGYAGGGLTVTVVFSMTSDHDEGTPHKVRWEIGFARIDDDGIPISGDHAYAFNGVSAIVPSVVSEVSYDDITFTDGADMDSLAAGEMAILRIYRDHDHGDDNATGDAELQMIMIKETV